MIAGPPGSHPVPAHSGDEHDRELIRRVRPPEWRNPRPAGRYNLVVVGAGTAGLVAAAGAAGLGARVALVERGLMGGDCLNAGCVPSKALLRCARAFREVREAERFGVRLPGEATLDFGAVMARMRRLRSRLGGRDSAARFRDLGVDVFLGEGRFTGPGSLVVEGARLDFARACIATGSRPVLPPIPGLEGAGCLTNENLFNLTELPPRLAVLGGGPIGCEMAQAFARFGARVRLIEAAPRLLTREDGEAAEIVAEALGRDGVELHLESTLRGVERGAEGLRLRLGSAGGGDEVATDRLLVSVGRRPNLEGLDLERAGVEADREGIVVDDRLRTANRRIYAAGDVCLSRRFTHTAEASARLVIRNALFFGRGKRSDWTVPWCTYTDPELARTGLNEKEAREKGMEVDTWRIDLSQVDRAVLDGEEEGFLKVHTRRGKDEIVGAVLVARHAGEMITQLTGAMTAGKGLGALAGTIHCYPTQAEVIRRAADARQRSRLGPTLAWLLARLLAWRR